MPLHDWTRVPAGIFHDFHNAWVLELGNALNRGLLPAGYYALSEQHAGKFIADILTLHTEAPEAGPSLPVGGIALADAPPKVARKLVGAGSLDRLRRTLAIRHVSGHRLVALIEIVSPANKDRADHVWDFVAKAVAALEEGVHVFVADVFAPGRHDTRGMHGEIWERFDPVPYQPPEDASLTLASYVAGDQIEAYVEHLAVGRSCPDMPLFLHAGWYVPLPLEETYQAAYVDRPRYWRDVLEAPSNSND